jgi:hypothetical protein
MTGKTRMIEGQKLALPAPAVNDPSIRMKPKPSIA